MRQLVFLALMCTLVVSTYAILEDCRDIQVYILESVAEEKSKALYDAIGVWFLNATVFSADFESRVFTPVLQLCGKQTKEWDTEDGKYIDTFCVSTCDSEEPECTGDTFFYWTYLFVTAYIPGVQGRGCSSSTDPSSSELTVMAQAVSDVHWSLDRFFPNGTFISTEDLYNTVFDGGILMERHAETKVFSVANPNVGSMTHIHQTRIA